MRNRRFLSGIFGVVSGLAWAPTPSAQAAPPVAEEEEDTGPPAVVAVVPLTVRGDIATRERNDVRGQLVNNLDLEDIRVVNDEVVGKTVPDGGCATTDCIGLASRNFIQVFKSFS